MTDYEMTKALIEKERMVVIMRGIPFEKLAKCAETMVEAGIKLVEVTFDQCAEDPAKKYQESIDEIRRAVGDKLVLGCGTCLSVPQVYAAYNAGAKYIVSPNTNVEVITNTKRLGLVSIPGALTPTEVCTAHDAGADYVKLFPGGAHPLKYISDVRGPLPHIKLLLSGGTSPEVIPEMMERGAHSFGIGLVCTKARAERDAYDEMKEDAINHLNAIRGFLNRQ